MAVPRLLCQKKKLVNSIVGTAILFFIPITMVIGRKITSYAVGLEKIALR